MNRICMIGIGSPFGDDRAGWYVIKYLQQEKLLQPLIPKKLLLHSCDRPYFNLLELVQTDEEVILIDAVRVGAAVGSWQELTLDDLAKSSKHLSTHGFGVIEALQFAEFFKTMPKKLQIFGIEIANVQGFEISAAVMQGVINLSQHFISMLLQ